MNERPRLKTGIRQLDELLGGGLLPGTLTVVLGAMGIGKTQLGLQFAHQGQSQEQEPGFLFDMTCRGDSQNHQAYAQRLFEWTLREQEVSGQVHAEDVWNRERARFDYIHLFRRSGRRVSIHDLEHEQWAEWKVELANKLHRAIAFMYGNFVHGARRCVIDGIEPVDRASDSFQLHTFDYLYHQILRKEAAWVARDLFREQFRTNADAVADHPYDQNDIACLLLCTSHEVMLDDLLTRSIESGDILSNANTILLMGKTREGSRIGRALAVAKHRGSACDDSIAPFEINESGIALL